MNHSNSELEFVDKSRYILHTPRIRLSVLWPFIVAIGQFIGLILLSVVKWHSYSLTWDFAIYDQAANLIAHGHLNPFSSVLGFSFLQNDFELIIWPIALVLLLFKSGLALLVVQDFSLALTSLITTLWIKDVVSEQSNLSVPIRSFLVGLGAGLIVTSPWIYWAASFDFHVEPVIMPFVVLAGRAFWNDSPRKGYFWAGIALLGGNVAATFLAGLGVTQILHGRRYLKSGIILIGLSLISLFVIERVVPGGIRGGSLGGVYGYLLPPTISHATVFSLALGALHHPLRILHVLWVARWNIYGEIAPSGLVGLLTPMGLGVPLVVLLTDNLMFIHGHVTFFGTPTYFQGITSIPFVVVGTIFIAAKLLTKIRHSWLSYTILVLITINALTWFIIWIPPIGRNLFNISPTAARTLSHVNQRILPSTEVISTQAFMGEFANRQWVTAFLGNQGTPIAVHTHSVLFLVSPYEGIELSPEIYELSRIEWLANLRGSHLIAHGGNIWAFSWTPPSGTRSVSLPVHNTWLPAWALRHPVGIPVLSGPPQDWHVSTGSREGYVIDGFYKRVNPGNYVAKFRISSTTPTLMEVWNATGNILLVQDEIPSTNGKIQSISIPFTFRHMFPTHFFRGTGVWRISPPPPSRQDQIELRVWASGQGETNIYEINILRSPPPNYGNDKITQGFIKEQILLGRKNAY